MGQKVNPNGLRIGISRPWTGQWYADRKKFAETLKQDIDIRRYLEPRVKEAGLSRIDIQRTEKKVIINVFVAKPGLVVNKLDNTVAAKKEEAKPEEAKAEATEQPAEEKKPVADKKAEKKPESIREGLQRIINGKVTPKQRKTAKPTDVEIKINLIEVKNPDFDANLVAQDIAKQIENRASFRMVQKKAIQRVMRAGAKGIKTATSGRLNGAEIARTEVYKDGALGLETLSANIDYALAEAHTIYGVIGVKVWIARPEGFTEEKSVEKSADRKFGGRGNRRPQGDRRPRANGNKPVAPTAPKKGE